MNVLSIGGSDPSAGAGIQHDIKTFYSLGCYGLTVITAITSQNTSNFSAVKALPPSTIRSQIRSILSDFDISAIKIGMVLTNKTIVVLNSELKQSRAPIILDPVLKSTTGGVLLKKNALKDFKKLLVPTAYAITPNVEEASVLSGIKINDNRDLKEASYKIQELGVKNIVVTGYETSKTKISDFVLSGDVSLTMNSKKIQTVNHGSGCTFSAALTVGLTEGNNFSDAVRFAKEYTVKSISDVKKIGKGIPIVEPYNDPTKLELEQGIKKFCRLHNVVEHIPQCQTNFVYSKPKPKKLDDCVGVQGRIVKTGNYVTVTGRLTYGASKHVATAVLTINKNFPKIRSAVNLKFDPKLIKMFQDKGYAVKSYDRRTEPKKVKKKVSSIEWGINNAIKNLKNPCDVIYHKGDFGKEAMILVFGENPKLVIKKLSDVLDF
ncbi:MAG: bifunctional hydroxymethylpyrimidine kinase/phosphomethylpyrimidine kinase [Nitrosopumilaceae archaeon]|nr:bifunctional hydroxymethylpyrimidine kinase/phosphomethylpyrimidine kinase [Nitrosopumilaceae archaeon]NIU00111.1 bifunctional hydroxymethylpyrimidine kinase/phosphomethylpyrimidine kinase [Nitrosopumilaceae archaeon]NIU86501.1 bifunctional hydroxymethylpyrimidine kinase/phosphomethylpyrimidine kinase [Nitrosopumilaceae archaeon]NIV65736.1 bifunctional hydroxymethylpyrimidine kinase/phosphomethylpyrimidine kinase [Nitrosopumilaceae archaeon]NIX60713.1 bifunctional hydroxymethylpyrimidine kin